MTYKDEMKQKRLEIMQRLRQEENKLKKEAIKKTAQSCYDNNRYDSTTFEIDECYVGGMLQSLTKFAFTEKQLVKAYTYISNQIKKAIQELKECKK